MKRNLEEVVKLQDNLNVMNVNESAFEALAAFEAADDTSLTELTSEYFNFDTKGTYNFVFTKMTTFTGEKGQIEAVELLMNKDGAPRVVINANTVMVNSLKKVQQLPCLVRVVYEGDVKGANGTYKSLKIQVLPTVVGK